MDFQFLSQLLPLADVLKAKSNVPHQPHRKLKMLMVLFLSFSTQPFTLMTSSSPRVCVFTKKRLFLATRHAQKK